MKVLRRRLLLQHVALTALVLAIAEAALWLLVQHGGRRDLETTLRKEIEKIASLTELEPDEAEIYTERVEEVRMDRQRLLWEVIQPNGEVLGGSAELATARLHLPAVGGSALAPERLEVDTIQHGKLGRVLVGRLRTVKQRLVKYRRNATMPPSMIFDVRAAIATAPADQAAQQVLGYLIAGFPVLLGITSLIAWWLVGRAVRPVELAFERERRFTGAASHELRTPLTAMLGELDLATRRDRSPHENAETLARLRPLVTRMSRVVEGLLTLARAEAGNLLLGATPFEVSSFLAEMMDVVRLLPGASRVTFASEADGSQRILGDSTLLSQAVRVLVENALIHGCESPVTVAANEESGLLNVSIQDAGPGFPAAILSRKASEPLSSRFGLRIVQAIMTAQGGTLTLENLPAGGARAAIRIPLTP